jgi:signal transduction histidine kinase
VAEVMAVVVEGRTERVRVLPRRAAVVSATALAAAGCTVAVLLRTAPGNGHPHLAAVPLVGLVALTGLAVTWSRPHVVLGWLLLLVAGLQATAIGAEAYGAAGAADPESPWRWWVAAEWMSAWAWPAAVGVALTVIPVVYPLGRVTSRRWVAVGAVGAVGTVLLALALAMDKESSDGPWSTPGWLVTAMGVTAAAMLAGAGAVLLPGTLARMARARSPERQQLLLFLSAAAVALVSLAGQPSQPWLALALSLPAAAVSVGVLRYHVGGIIPVLRGGLLFVILTALVTAVMVVVSGVLAPVVSDVGLRLVAASAVVAVAIVPTAGWVRRQVDRLLLGSPVDPIIALDLTPRADRVERGHDPLQSALVGLVEGIGVRYAAVLDEAGRTLASSGDLGDREDPVERVTLRSGRDPVGYLAFSSLKDLGGRRLVAALAVHIAAVLRAQQLAADVQAERRRVVEAAMAERERVRQDLHDGLGPSLSGISLSLQAADSALDRDASTARALLRRAAEEADLAGAEVRRVIDRLRPAALDEADLESALRAAARRLGFDDDGAPTLRMSSRLSRSLPPAVEDAAYRIVHEALHNVIRHADAQSCAVTAVDLETSLVVSITDDGRGIDDAVHAGLGLVSMQQRAASAGGNVEIMSPVGASGHGTRITMTLPLTQDST